MQPGFYRRVAAIALGLTAARLLVYAALARFAPGDFALADFALARALCQWDCGWYLSIVQHGYDAAPHLVDGWWQANWAFFPLYPLLVRSLDTLTGGNPKIAGVMVSTACFVVFAVLGARYRQVTRGDASPWPWLLLVSVWPFGFYFHAVYSEALYAALATAALLALSEGFPLAAGFATALLTATRPTGILLAAWIGLDRLWRARSAGTASRALWLLVPAAIAPLGLLAFMGFLYLRVGDPLAFLHIQSGWRHAARNPLAVLTDALRGFDPVAPRAGPFYLVGWAGLGVAASVWLLATRRFAEAWLCGMTVLMGLASGTLFSMPRFVAANPAFLFAAADILGAIRWPGLRATLLLGLAGLQVVLVLFWYRGAAFLL